MSSMHPIRREPHHVEVMDRRWLSNQVFEVTLKRPEGFSFRVGQSIRGHRKFVNDVVFFQQVLNLINISLQNHEKVLFLSLNSSNPLSL